MKLRLIVILIGLSLISFSQKESKDVKKDSKEIKKDDKKPAEFKIDTIESKHLKNIKQLTWGGDNAEAYFSPNGKYITFQSNNKAWGVDCDQIYLIELKEILKDSTYTPPRISTGQGRTTCSFFMPNNKQIIYASTHKGSNACPPVVEIKGKYIWGVYKDYDIYVGDFKGNIIKQLTDAPGYDAEASISPKGDKIVFTSDRSGDLELWTMDIDGKNLMQVTRGLGYDGGAFFSPDGKKLVFRASRPKTGDEKKEYKDLLAKNLVAPGNMEIYTCNVDGSDFKKITELGKANWSPYFTPDGKKIIFASNHHSKKGYDFQLWMINVDGTGLERITNISNYNSFPMFSPNGKKIIFSSNRNNYGTKDTNLFIADWVD